MGWDRRLIQTGVRGDAASDDPVICPVDAEELDVFRREFAGETWWCGVLLGGCGAQLRTRRCETRVSHFFHLPDPDGQYPPCTRRSHDSGSADHLYVKASTHAWLRRQGHEPHYRFPDHSEAPLGSVVDIRLAGRRLRIHMDPALPADWNGADGEVVLGPGVPVSRDRLLEQGYVHRIRFDSQGSTRVPTLGTQTPQGTEWFPIEACEIGEDGRLTTPAVTRVRRALSSPAVSVSVAPVTGSPVAVSAAPLAVPAAAAESAERLPLQIGAMLRRIKTAVRENDGPRVRELVHTAEQQRARCEGIALDRLEAVLSDAAHFLENQQRLRTVLFGRLREAEQARALGAVRSLLGQINDFLRHDGPPTRGEAELMAAARRLRRPTPPARPATRAPRPGRPSSQERAEDPALKKARRLIRRLNQGDVRSAREERRIVKSLAPLLEEIGDRLSALERRDAQSWIDRVPAPRTPAKPAAPAPRQEEPSLEPDKLRAAAAAVRGALKKAAREQTVPTWERLEQQLGSALPKMTADDQVRLLIAVDEGTPGDQALLSSLLAASDSGLRRHYPAVAAASGLDVPDDEGDLRDVLEADVQQVYDHWRHA